MIPDLAKNANYQSQSHFFTKIRAKQFMQVLSPKQFLQLSL